MRLVIFVIFVFYLPFLFKKVESQIGIDGDDGDASKVYNKSYSEHQSSLEAKIFRAYNPRNRPVKNGSMPTIVDVHWHVIHVSINQKEQTMTLHGHIYMRWFDEFLVWDPKDYNGIHYARVKKWQVWQPRIKVSNSASGLGSAFDFSTSAHVIIQMVEKNRAKVEMYPTFSIKVGCNFDFGDYPYDKNRCSVNLFSTATMADVQLQNLYSIPPTLSFGWEEQKMKRIISDFKINNVTCSSFYYSGGNISRTPPVTGFELGTTWSMLAVNVEFERHDPLFLAAIVMPSFISAVMCQASFFIIQKHISLFVHLSITYIQIIFLQDLTTPLPLVISRLPSSVRLFSILFIFNCTISLICSIFIALTYTKYPVPLYFQKIHLLDQWIPKYMVERKQDSQPIDGPLTWEDFNRTFRTSMGLLLIPVFLLLFIVCLLF
uniref:Acetylcholine receptor-like protein cup-4 n=1 Tax=Caenorhabditis tropicalis TaxID=1561998 RepID=A0A1I7THI1_9PELO